MARHRLVHSPGIYFITFACYNWISLIDRTNAYDKVYHFFNLLNERQAMIAFVIMPNHLHLILHYRDSRQTLNTIIGNGKRFMAYEIIKRLRNEYKVGLLHILSNGVLPGEYENHKRHSVWRESFDSKECRTEKFVAQKLGYIHHNPISGKWRLSESFIDYEHSSAKFYHTGNQHPKVQLTHFRDALQAAYGD